MLEKASRSVWELILDNNGLGKEISETVERVYCRLSGQEPPLFPLPNSETQPNKENENKGGEEREAECENQKEKSYSNSKKRSYSEMNMAGGENEVASQIANEVAGKSGDPHLLREGSGKSSPSTSKT